MTPLQKTIDELKHKAQATESRTEGKAAAKAVKALVEQQAATAETVAQQQKELQQLRQELADLSASRSSGGFPWTWLLLAGGAYALYRFNPTVREQVQGLLNRVTTGVENTTVEAEDTLSNAAQNERPLAVVERVAAEVQQTAAEDVNTSQGGTADQDR